MTTPDDLVKLARECGAWLMSFGIVQFDAPSWEAFTSHIAAKSIDDTSILRRALLAIKFNAPSLADAQVIALRALNEFEPQEAVEPNLDAVADPRMKAAFLAYETATGGHWQRMEAVVKALEAPVQQAADLRQLFLDAISWGRSYGRSPNITDMVLSDVAEGYAEQATKSVASQAREPEARCPCGYPMPCSKKVPVGLCRFGLGSDAIKETKNG